MARRRRRSYEKKKPVAMPSVWASIVGLICFLLALSLVFLSASGVDFGKIPGTIGVITMLVSMIATGVGVRSAREPDHEAITRAIGVIVPAVAMVVLIAVYFMGILFG